MWFAAEIAKYNLFLWQGQRYQGITKRYSVYLAKALSKQKNKTTLK
jgi:hypothetical protein